MDTRTLIDSIVRQTTVLIAQLSTAAGVRAPLAHVADQVFVDLAHEIERQGVRQKVVADMFGIALRTYQKKMQRLSGSVADRGRTLWEAVVGFIAERERATRATIEDRFRHEEERDVAAVLKDLVESGLVYCTGQGPSAVYGMTSALDRQAQRDAEQLASLHDFVWLAVFLHGPLSANELARLLPYPDASIDDALKALVNDGRIERTPDALTSYRCGQFSVPVGATSGWEAAVFDHFQAVAIAIAAKVGDGAPRSGTDDVVGGATLRFDLSPTHPMRSEVLGLLKRVRAEVNDLWNRVEHHNTVHPLAISQLERVCFYFGQHCTRPAAPTFTRADEPPNTTPTSSDDKHG